MADLIDTGVLLRLFERGDSRYFAIRQAIRTLARRGERMVTAAQNIAEFWNVSTRPSSARGGYGHSVIRVERRVAIIERFCDVVLETERSYVEWKRLVTTHQISGVAVHDARLVAIMLDQGVSHLLTLNPGDFSRYLQVTTVEPDGM